MYNIQKLKAVALLRVSTDKQTNDDNDIPTQRKLIQEFIEKEELILIREFVEGGISAFKTKMANRDALQTIKRMASKHEFDILIVYKSDRIGRTSDESPLVINYLNTQGIRVFTTHDGEIKTSTQMDKLMTYLTFWQNETESVKLSERATDYHKLLIQDGKYKGGFIPFGYKLVNKGSQNFKGRNIYDFEIDHEQAEIVKLIYNLSIKKNMGARAIAKYLNEHGYKNKSKNENGWSFTSVNHILHNVIYKGYFHMHSKVRNENILSPKQEHLIIIPEETWELNQQIIKNRKTRISTTDNNGNTKTEGVEPKGSSNGNGLLSGIAYCGYCKSKMHMWNNHKYYYTKTGEKKKIIKTNYRCKSALSAGRIKCIGQSTYSVLKIDKRVEDDVKKFMLQMKNKELSEQFKKDLLNSFKILNEEKNKKELLLENKQMYLINLKKERALYTDPNYNGTLTIQEVRETINLIQEDVDKLLNELNEIDIKILNTKQSINSFNETNQKASNWLELYDKSNLEEKKYLILDAVKKAYIFKEKVQLIMNPTYIVFAENCIPCTGSEIESFALPNRNNTLPIEFIRTVEFSIAL